jgi:chromate reductase
MRILAISGSLRTISSNTSVLQAAALLAPPESVIVLYKDLQNLPHFNPDWDGDDPPDIVKALRREVALADGMIICSPEYAHGVAGSMKNALDWLVGSCEFPGKPIALINTSDRAVHSPAQLRETLITMSARFVDEASITLRLVGRRLDAAGIANDAALSREIRAAIDALIEAASPERRAV